MATKTAPRNGKAPAKEIGSVPRPIDSGVLSLQAIIQPKAQDRWLSLVRRDYTVADVKAILDGTNSQSLFYIMGLFDMMLDAWPHLFKVVHEVRTGVQKTDWVIQPRALKGQKPTPSAQEKAAFVQSVLFDGMKPDPTTGQQDFGGMVYDIMDAYAKGVSVIEMDWRKEPNGEFWLNGTRWVRPVHYDYPQAASEIERLRLTTSGKRTDLQDFPPNKFVIATYRAKSDVMITRCSRLRTLAPWWVFSTFATEWMMNFAQLFGIPIRWATYNKANRTEKAVLTDALINMGSAGWGLFPEGTNLNLHEASRATGDAPQAWISNKADELASLLFLGQTLTSKVGDSGSRALGDVHQSVRADVITDGQQWVASVLNAQVIPAIVALNYGNLDELPSIGTEHEESEGELKSKAERDKVLFVDMGLPVEAGYLYERHGVPQPAEGAVLFKPASSAPANPFGKARPALPGGQDPEDPEGNDGQDTAVPDPEDEQAMAEAIERLPIKPETRAVLRGLPLLVRAHYVNEIAEASGVQPYSFLGQYGDTVGEGQHRQRHLGGQPGGGRFKAELRAKAEDSVEQARRMMPPLHGTKDDYHIEAFGLSDNAAEFHDKELRKNIGEVEKAARKAKVVDVPIESLKTSQRHITAGKVKDMLDSTAKLPPITVLTKGGTSWLWDGHHRTVAAKLMGEQSIKARVVAL